MPEAPDAPAPSGPEGGEPQVDIALGPDLTLYPENLRPVETPPAPPEAAPEPGPLATSPTESDVAGAVEPPSEKEGESRGTRRRAAEDAYQRGLAEGRAVLEREQSQHAEQQQREQTQREANQRVEQLFSDLESADYGTQDRARRGILQMYRGNAQAQALMTTTRQQILSEMATDFARLGELDGLDQDGYQSLHTAPSAAELAKRAFDLGKKARDDQVARLEAELQGLRGRLVGTRATPERANGSGAPNLGGLSIEEYTALSPKDAAKVSPAQIDAMVAQFLADQANGRS